ISSNVLFIKICFRKVSADGLAPSDNRRKGRQQMQTVARDIMQEMKSLDLQLFSSGRVHVLFCPETLQLFRMSELSASALRAGWAGEGLPELAIRYSVSQQKLESFFAGLVEAVKSSRPAAAPQVPMQKGSPLGSVLPKLVFMVNNYCNLKCTYCYEHETVFKKKSVDMPQFIVRTALDKFYEAFRSIGQLMFIGGEPTLSEDVVEQACQYASQLAQERGCCLPSFAMITNGARMTERMFEVIRKYEIQVTFSMDGPKKVHDLVRIRHDNSGSYDEVADNIKRYSALFADKLGIECTLTAAHRKAG